MRVQVQVARALRALVPPAFERRLARTLARAGRRVGVSSNVGLTVRIATSDEVEALHLSFFGLPGATDVLSFPDEEDEAHLGDVVVGWTFARQQAHLGGDDPDTSIIDLCLHGLAHVLGHDHDTRPRARRMLRFERRLARRAVMPPPRRPYA